MECPPPPAVVLPHCRFVCRTESSSDQRNTGYTPSIDTVTFLRDAMKTGSLILNDALRDPGVRAIFHHQRR